MIRELYEPKDERTSEQMTDQPFNHPTDRMSE